MQSLSQTESISFPEVYCLNNFNDPFTTVEFHASCVSPLKKENVPKLELLSRLILPSLMLTIFQKSGY